MKKDGQAAAASKEDGDGAGAPKRAGDAGAGPTGGKHYDSREAAAARNALPQQERTLTLTLKTEDQEIFVGEKTVPRFSIKLPQQGDFQKFDGNLSLCFSVDYTLHPRTLLRTRSNCGWKTFDPKGCCRVSLEGR